MLESTVSGQLRRAISESGMGHRELADQTGLSPKALAEFLAGAAALDSVAIDKLATLLKRELTPIG
jgi:transcriptional regulator with XRE-family HTH domain